MTTERSKNRNVKGESVMDSMIKNKEELEKSKRFKSSLKIILIVGIGAGLYGYKLGKQSGLIQGIDMGYVVAGQDMVAALREHAAELKLSRAE